MSAQETDQLFGVFDADGSGSLDYGEFCQVLDALPLRAVKESPLGYAVSAAEHAGARSQLVSALSIEQLASAGRVFRGSRARGSARTMRGRSCRRSSSRARVTRCGILGRC